VSAKSIKSELIVAVLYTRLTPLLPLNANEKGKVQGCNETLLGEEYT